MMDDKKNCNSKYANYNKNAELLPSDRRRILERLGMRFIGESDHKSPCFSPFRDDKNPSAVVFWERGNFFDSASGEKYEFRQLIKALNGDPERELAGYNYQSRQPKKTPKPKPTKDWSGVANGKSSEGDQYSQFQAQRMVESLAREFEVSVKTLERVGIKWQSIPRLTEDGKFKSTGGGWTIPEKDGKGKVIGVARRFLGGGRKGFLGGGNRGLTHADDWDTGGPILIVEGASDTAVGCELGFSVIGKPSNLGGADLLADLLRDVPSDRRIISMGENDSKRQPDGTVLRPGASGAVAIGRHLANSLNRQIEIAEKPPALAKDLCEWNQKVGGTGQEFLDGLHLRTITPESTDDTCVSGECPKHHCQCETGRTIEQALAEIEAGDLHPETQHAASCRCVDCLGLEHPLSCECVDCDREARTEAVMERLLDPPSRCMYRGTVYRGKTGVTRLTPCNCWWCDHCRPIKVAERREHLQSVIRGLPNGSGLYTATFDESDEKKMLERIRLAGKKYNAFRFGDRTVTVLVDGPFPGGERLSKAESDQLVREATARMDDGDYKRKKRENKKDERGQKSYPITTSDDCIFSLPKKDPIPPELAWKVPKDENGKPMRGTCSAIKKAVAVMGAEAEGYETARVHYDDGIGYDPKDTVRPDREASPSEPEIVGIIRVPEDMMTIPGTDLPWDADVFWSMLATKANDYSTPKEPEYSSAHEHIVSESSTYLDTLHTHDFGDSGERKRVFSGRLVI